ncbi:MAG: sigma 54-dependent transcriptional regulator, partial [Lentisphaeria bacterium]|nr:sigma 54-dependent transcriptional regulator [Lentisphaeria bacterium]
MNILISLLGSTLDGAGRRRGLARWNVWRPSVALAMQKDLHFDRYHLIYQPKFCGLKEQIVEDIRQCSPSTEVIPEAIMMDDPWDFEEVYS